MSTYRLDHLFSPRSVAIVGASPRPASIGRAVLTNLRAGAFAGTIGLVNPHHSAIDGHPAVPSLADLADPPDLVVISVPPAEVHSVVAQAGAAGVAAAVILSAGLGNGPGSLAEAVQAEARRTGLRIVGPNCIGVIAPAARLNASFASAMPRAGNLALISQSGAIAAGLVDWAATRNVGFSAIVSIGDQIDVDVGDLLDFFALDPASRAILLYVESIRDARKFMSAARAAARVKPVVVVKAGRQPAGAKAAATHTGALAGSDAVYDAAFRRAGLLRVTDLDELFDAAETLGRVGTMHGRRLAILTNGGGLGVLAADLLSDLGGTLAALSADTTAALNAALPPTWSKANPVDIIGDADGARYSAAMTALLDGTDSDAILVMNVHTAIAGPADTADAVIAATVRHRAKTTQPKAVLATWVGAAASINTRFNDAGIPSYETEADAVRGFMHLVRFEDARHALMETPPSLPNEFQRDAERARAIVASAIREQRTWLDPIEVNDLLAAYGIPTVPTKVAADPDRAAAAAEEFLAAGQSVVVKIFSREIIHKSDVGGVKLDLTTADAVRRATSDILARARVVRPDAKLLGVTLQPMIVRPQARELLVGIADDPTFGPVIAFGSGGTAVEIVNDKALALPPLDLKLAHDLVARTRVARLLRAYRNVPAAREDEVALALVKLAQLAADVPELHELDVNPLLADETGILAIDARIAVAHAHLAQRGAGRSHFAVRPYPAEWERDLGAVAGRRIAVRPIRPEDEMLLVAFLNKVSQEDLRLRFFAAVRHFDHVFVARLTQLDYARAMAFIAFDRDSAEVLGVVRLHSDANYETGEYAILLRSDMKGRGLGWTLMRLIIDYARAEGLKRIDGQVLKDNATMLRMCDEMGFSNETDPGDPQLRRVSLPIEPA